MSPNSLSLCTLSLAAGIAFAPAASVSLSSVVGSHTQGGAYATEFSIDEHFGTGWGFDGGQYAAQTGVFIPGAPVTASQLEFMLYHTQFGNHYVQEFRISTTTDASPSVGSSWTPLSPTELSTRGGTTISSIGGGFARVTGSAGAVVNHQLVASGAFTGVTGFLLEMNPYDFNTGDAIAASIGRSPSNGNAVLTEFVVTTDGDLNWARNQPAGFFNASGVAINPYSNPVGNMVDGVLDNYVHAEGPANDGYYAQVDLGAAVFIDRIELTGRAYYDNCCPERLQGYTLEFYAADGTTQVGSIFHAAATTTTETIPVSGLTGAAQYVRVVNSTGPTFTSYAPQIGEIAVFGSTIPEPSSALLGLLGSLLFLRRRR